jgi:hypothetical protein
MSARDELYAVLRLAGEDRAEVTRLLDAHKAEVLREASEVAVSAARACGDNETGQYAASVAAGIGKELRRLANNAEAGTPTS